MGKLDTVLKAEILRLARKEMRPVVLPLQRQVKALTRQVRALSQQVSKLSKSVARSAASARKVELPAAVPTEELEGVRMSGGLIQKLRKRLGVTQSHLAALVGVSAAAVQSWEQNIARPAGANKAAIVALRKLGRRDIAELLRHKGVEKAGRKPRIGQPRKAAAAKAPARKPAGRRGRKGRAA